MSALREVLRTLVENGGTIFDTAPGYGASEEVAGARGRLPDDETRRRMVRFVESPPTV